MSLAARSSRIAASAFLILATFLPPMAEASTMARAAQRSGGRGGAGRSHNKGTTKPPAQATTPSTGSSGYVVVQAPVGATVTKLQDGNNKYEVVQVESEQG
jgi:hypothetical protein